MEFVLLMGLASLGYALANKKGPVTSTDEEDGQIDPKETFMNPQGFEMGQVELVQDPTGHNNMVPFFGANMTQSMYSGATESMLDKYTGQGVNTFHHKEEAPAFFKPEAGNGNPWGAQIETDFEQSRQVTSQRMANVFPVERVNVGPGVNDGYTNLPSGGYQQDAMRDYALPKTTDETRVATKPKLTYEGEVVPGAHFITEMGLQAPVKKNKPDRYAVLGMEHVNTTTGQQMASAIYPETLMKEQNRANTSTEFKGPAESAAGGYLSYIRAFTEPYQEFMKLTVEGRPTPGGPVAGKGVQAGPESYAVTTHRNEDIFTNVRGFEAPLFSQGGQAPQAAQQGSVRYTEPLKQDYNVERNNMPGLLDAFNSNPYTQSLTSSA
uniref:DUF5899 domain-containing protein n=1 Tax=viral metagenome TaxID=1070528 RepID=A0A6C0J5I2_9ZZZZ